MLEFGLLIIVHGLGISVRIIDSHIVHGLGGLGLGLFLVTCADDG